MPLKGIHDSGEREAFEGGAVRDASEGKPSFRLISPFILAGWASKRLLGPELNHNARAVWKVVEHCAKYRITKEPYELVCAFDQYVAHIGVEPAMERLSRWTDLGAKKYSDRNWEKGMPVWRTLDSLLRHCFKRLRNCTVEDHDAAILWNLMAAVHYIGCVESGSLTPDVLQDLPDYQHERKYRVREAYPDEEELEAHLPDGTLDGEIHGDIHSNS